MRLNYKTKVLLSAEETSQKDINYAVERTKLELSADILATRQKIAELQSDIEKVKTTYPLDTKAYIELTDELEQYNKGLDKVLTLQKELGFC